MDRAAWAAIACLAVSTRPLLFGVTPLLPAVQSDLGASFSTTALLVTVPVLCLGLSSFAAPWLVARIGVALTTNVALATMLAAGLARALLPELGGILVASVPLGVGAGIAGVVLPMLVKATVDARAAATATGVYTVGLQLGGAITAGVAVPLALAVGGWRPAFIVIAGATGAAIAGWLLLHRPSRRVDAGARLDHPRDRPSRRRWLAPAIAAFALLLVTFQGLNSWLPAFYVDQGWSEAAGGSLLAVLVFAQVPGTLAAGFLGDRVGRRRSYLVLPGVILATSIGLLVAVPVGAWLWSVSAGLALGFIAPIALVLALDFGTDIIDVGRGAATIFGVGYAIASVSPFAIGVGRDATGSFAVGLVLLAGLALGIAVAGFAVPAAPPQRAAKIV